MHYEKREVSSKIIKKVEVYTQDPMFTYDVMMKVSSAAAALCQWVLSVVYLHQIRNGGSPPRIASPEKNVSPRKEEVKKKVNGKKPKKAEVAVQEELKQEPLDLTEDQKEELKKGVEALNCLNKRAIQEMKSLANPPA